VTRCGVPYERINFHTRVGNRQRENGKDMLSVEIRRERPTHTRPTRVSVAKKRRLLARPDERRNPEDPNHRKKRYFSVEEEKKGGKGETRQDVDAKN